MNIQEPHKGMRLKRQPEDGGLYTYHSEVRKGMDKGLGIERRESNSQDGEKRKCL